MKRLNTINEVAQIISAVAVVASLVYVGREIQANTAATQAATRQAVAEADFAYFTAMIDSDVLVHGMTKVMAGDSVSAAEGFVLGQHQALNFRIFENAHYQYESGLLTAETWERYRRIIAFLLVEFDAAQSMWDSTQWSFDDSFRAEVARILANPPAGVPVGACAGGSMGSGSVECR